jgi:TonB family protein
VSDLPNLYELLGVPEDATLADIKSAYRSLSFLYHPDRLSDVPERNREHAAKHAEETIKAIISAYEILSDPETREQFDEALREDREKSRPPSSQPPPSGPPPPPNPTPSGGPPPNPPPPNSGVSQASALKTLVPREWAIGLGWIAGFVFALVVGGAAESLLALLPRGPRSSLLHGCVAWWTVATAVLFGVALTGLLSGEKRRAGIAAFLGIGSTVMLAILVTIATFPTAQSSSASAGLSPASEGINFGGQIVGSLSPATRLPAWLRAITGPRTVSSDNYPPPGDFQIRDRCAGEGCGYQRPWRALSATPLYAAWDKPNGGQLYTVSEREIVTALSGIWITKKPAVFEVQETITIAGVALKRGDFIYVLMYLGAGMVRGFFHGTLADFDLGENDSKKMVALVPPDKLESVLWVQMKTSTGIVGWTKDASYPSFDGQRKPEAYIKATPEGERDGLWDYELEVCCQAASIKIASETSQIDALTNKVHTGFVIRPNETQAIDLIANDGGELLAKIFVRPGTPQLATASEAPPATVKPSFNCANAIRPTETIICRDSDLANTELAMVAAHDEVQAKLSGTQEAAFLKEHLEWFKDWASTCDATAVTGTEKDLKDCVTRYLSNRIVQLKQSIVATNARAGGAYRIGGGVSAPSVLSKVEPGYSEEARKAKWQGTVVLSLVVDEQGRPRNLKVLRSLGLGLDQKAIEAVGKWRFNPGMKDGKPVPVMATIEVNFRLL